MEPFASQGRAHFEAESDDVCPHCGKPFDPPVVDQHTVIRCDECETEAPQWQFFGHDKPE